MALYEIIRCSFFPKKIDNNFKKEFDLNQIYDEIPALAINASAFRTCNGRDSLSKSPSMIAAKEKWLKDSDNIARFIEDRCRIELDTNGGDSSRNIYKAYQDYCWEEKLNLKPFSQPEFTRRLEAQGIPRKKVQFNNAEYRVTCICLLKTIKASQRVEKQGPLGTHGFKTLIYQQ